VSDSGREDELKDVQIVVQIVVQIDAQIDARIEARIEACIKHGTRACRVRFRWRCADKGW
jgi:hypothetical protein